MSFKEMAHNVMAQWRLSCRPCVVSLAFNRRNSKTIDEILSGLDSDVEDRAEGSGGMDMKLKDKPLPFEWEYSVTTGGPRYTVIVRALAKEEQIDEEAHVRDMDVKVSCSCPYWRWQGPEYHAKKEDYLKGGPRGTASTPDIRDPERDNYACKHVAYVLEIMKRSPTYTVG